MRENLKKDWLTCVLEMIFLDMTPKHKQQNEKADKWGHFKLKSSVEQKKPSTK